MVGGVKATFIALLAFSLCLPAVGADKEIIITDPALKAYLVKEFDKPSGKFAPPVKFTKAELEKVTILDLRYRKITDASFKDIAKLQQLTQLKVGADDRVNITDESLKEVAKLQQLTSLIIHASQFTDAGLKEIAKCKKLTTLYLSYSQITDAGLKEVAKLKKLKKLYLVDTKITDAGLRDLAKLQKLEIIDLSRTKITDEGAAELKKALPLARKYNKFHHSYKK